MKAVLSESMLDLAVPDDHRVPKVLDYLMHEHKKVEDTSLVNKYSYEMMESVVRADDLVMSWFWNVDTQRFVNQTDIQPVPFKITELPFDTMVFEFARAPDGDTANVAYGCLIVRTHCTLRLLPVAYAKWDKFRKPYWGYLPEGYKMDQDVADNFPNVLTIDPEAKELSVNFDSEGKELAVKVIEYTENAYPKEISHMAKSIVANTLHYLYKLLVLLECNNAPFETVKPSALKQRINRQRKNAPEIKPYRILKLSSKERGESRQMGDGESISVRTHLRRGHIRNQKTARGHIRRWIKPCIVNAHKADQIINETVIT